MEYATDRQPWDQQPGESDTWYPRFVAYLKLKNRSLNEAFRREARKNNKRKGQTKSDEIRRRDRGRIASATQPWVDAARVWRWEERAALYDRYLRAEQDKRTEQARNDALSELTAQAKSAAKRLGEVLKGKIEGDPSAVAQSRLAANDILDRIGVPRTSRTQIENDGDDGTVTVRVELGGLDRLTLDEKRTCRDMARAKAAGNDAGDAS